MHRCGITYCLDIHVQATEVAGNQIDGPREQLCYFRAQLPKLQATMHHQRAVWCRSLQPR